MGDETIEGEWVVLEVPMVVCAHCIHNKACKDIQRQISQCTAAKYQFRCPILVFMPQKELSHDTKRI